MSMIFHDWKHGIVVHSYGCREEKIKEVRAHILVNCFSYEKLITKSISINNYTVEEIVKFDIYFH